MGVVSSFVTSHEVSDGFMCSVTLIDESKLEVKCSMFQEDRASLPPQLYPGDIICLKGSTTEGLVPHVTLNTDAGSGWVVFTKSDGYKQTACSMKYRVPDKGAENARVEELKKWSTAEGGRGFDTLWFFFFFCFFFCFFFRCGWCKMLVFFC